MTEYRVPIHPAVRFTSIGWASCTGEFSPAEKATGPESRPDVSIIQVVSSSFVSVSIWVVQLLPKGCGKSSSNTSVESPLVTNFIVYLPSGSTRIVTRCSTQLGNTRPMNRINIILLRFIIAAWGMVEFRNKLCTKQSGDSS